MEDMGALAVLLTVDESLVVVWDLLQGSAADSEWKQGLECLHYH
jgi:hypothetical protein